MSLSGSGALTSRGPSRVYHPLTSRGRPRVLDGARLRPVVITRALRPVASTPACELRHDGGDGGLCHGVRVRVRVRVRVKG